MTLRRTPPGTAGTSDTPAATDSYDPAHFAPLFAVEDRHFWFRARARLIATLVQQIVTSLPSGYRVLEVGCGTGQVLRVLEQTCTRGIVMGMDLFIEGLRFARRRVNVPLIQSDIHASPFTVGFEVIGLFDVLEHLPDDRAVLRDLHAMLSPGGVLILTVPAHQSLWSYFDEAAHHCRRYEPEDLMAKLGEAGFLVEYLSPFMSLLFPLIWAGRRLASSVPRRGMTRATANGSDANRRAQEELRIIPVVNGVLAGLLMTESAWVKRRQRLPGGTSLVAVARKREQPA